MFFNNKPKYKPTTIKPCTFTLQTQTKTSCVKQITFVSQSITPTINRPKIKTPQTLCQLKSKGNNTQNLTQTITITN